MQHQVKFLMEELQLRLLIMTIRLSQMIISRNFYALDFRNVMVDTWIKNTDILGTKQVKSQLGEVIL